MAYWTHYWTNDTFRYEAEFGRDELVHTADNVFRQRGVAPGDVVYVVTNLKGTIYLIGRMVVDRVLDQQAAEKLFGLDVWQADDHLIAREPMSKCRYNVTVPFRKLKDIEFITDTGLDVIKFDQRVGADPHTVDRQTLRGVREITASTAGLFDSLLR